MSFPRYPKYKASGVEWLGEVPEHWEVRRLKQACTATPSNVDKKSHEGEKQVRLCNYVDVYYNDEITEAIDFMVATASDDQITKFTLRAGDTIITKDSETADDIAIAAFVPRDLPGVVCGYHLSMIRPRSSVDGRFIKWLFGSRYAKGCFAVLANGLTRVGLGQHDLENIDFAFPPLAEQRAIAAFLDRETKKIDELVAEQERLIELLKEKRQAVISHAVTKGLDRAAPMKPSGVEWLGEVPAHWEMRRLKQACTATPSNVDKKSHEGEEQVRLCNYVDVYYNDEITEAIDFMVATASDAQIAKFTLRAGDTIITKDSETADDIAIAAFVPRDLPGVVCGYHLSMIRPKRSADGRFIKWLFGSRYAKGCFAVRANGLTRVGLGQHDLENIDFAFPPLEEQRAIATFLARETAKIDTLVAQAESAISLLTERRSALISAAVTGQIDVRNAVPSATPTEAA
jgi:type I restriction enzyme S subunit